MLEYKYVQVKTLRILREDAYRDGRKERRQDRDEILSINWRHCESPVSSGYGYLLAYKILLPSARMHSEGTVVSFVCLSVCYLL